MYVFVQSNIYMCTSTLCIQLYMYVCIYIKERVWWLYVHVLCTLNRKYRWIRTLLNKNTSCALMTKFSFEIHAHITMYYV